MLARSWIFRLLLSGYHERVADIKHSHLDGRSGSPESDVGADTQ